MRVGRCAFSPGLGGVVFRRAHARSFLMIGRIRIYASLALACAIALASLVHAQPRTGGHALLSMVICTPDGLVRLSLEGEEKPDDADHFCPDCVLPVVALLAGHPAVPDREDPVHDRQPILGEVWAGGSAGLWSEERSPPAPV